MKPPEGWVLVPDRFKDQRLHFYTPDDIVSIRVLMDGPLPEKIGPFMLTWSEMGAARYEMET